MDLTKKTSLTIVLAFWVLIAGCSEDKLSEDATIFQKAVFNQSRPEADRKTDKLRKPSDVLSFAGLQQGMRVVDMDAGSGYYSEIANYIVGQEGAVFLQNSLRYTTKYPEKIGQRLAGNRLANVERIDSSYIHLGLPENVDLILIVKAFHDLYVRRSKPGWNADIASYFAQLNKALRIGGKILVVDHAASKGSGKEHASTLHRIDEKFVQELFESKGFKLISSSDLLRNPDDERTLKVWNASVRGQTDRFVYLFEKQ